MRRLRRPPASNRNQRATHRRRPPSRHRGRRRPQPRGQRGRCLAAGDLPTRLTVTRLEPGPDGLLRLPETPGLGVRPDLECVREYLQPLRVGVAEEGVYRTPTIDH
jgi:hypothetical protein